MNLVFFFFVTMCAAEVTPTGDRSLVQDVDQGKADPNFKQENFLINTNLSQQESDIFILPLFMSRIHSDGLWWPGQI